MKCLVGVAILLLSSCDLVSLPPITPTDVAVTRSPKTPLIDWAVADTGTIYALDANHILFRLASDTLNPLAHTPDTVLIKDWDVAPTGHLFALDTAYQLYQLNPDTLTLLKHTSPIFPAETVVTDLLVGTDYLFIGNQTITQTVVLNQVDFGQVMTIDHAGEMAVDPGNRFFLSYYVQKSYGLLLWRCGCI